MEYDYFKVYFGTDSNGYDNPIYVDTLEQVEQLLNNGSINDKYLVIGHNKQYDEDTILCAGKIEINNKRKR